MLSGKAGLMFLRHQNMHMGGNGTKTKENLCRKDGDCGERCIISIILRMLKKEKKKWKNALRNFLRKNKKEPKMTI